MSKPELSIVIPAWNCGHKIETMVDSILSQDYTNYELIIVDDHSATETAQILDKLAKKDHRINVYHRPRNGGASAARNFGIKKARGKFIMLFDADDRIKPNTLSAFTDEIKKTNAELVVSGFIINTVKDDQTLNSVDVCKNKLPDRGVNEPWRIYILRLLGLDGRLYQVWNKIYRADIIKKNHLQFQPNVNFGEDLVFNLDYYAHMTGRIAFLLNSYYIYDQDLTGGTFSRSSLIYRNRVDNYAAVEKFVGDIDYPTKDDLLHWLKYNWIYSHMLAATTAEIPRNNKINMIQDIAKCDGDAPLSDSTVIGKKRYQVEKMLHYLVHHPSQALGVIDVTMKIKNNHITANLWQALRRSINK